VANYSENKVSETGGTENTLSRRVYTVLRDDILAGRLKFGERLVRKTISKRLGVSTIPVIEALYMLEIDGYVENLPLVGCRVKSLTLDDIDNGLMLREALECQAARLCTENATPEDFEKLMNRARQVDRLMRADTPDQTLGSQIHWEFHIELGRMSGHSVFSEMLQKGWFQRYMSLNSLKSIRFEPPPDGWHQILVKRIKKGDPDEAERAMREHVRFGRKHDRDALKVYLLENTVGGKRRKKE